MMPILTSSAKAPPAIRADAAVAIRNFFMCLLPSGVFVF
jgi:hypothetical protein